MKRGGRFFYAPQEAAEFQRRHREDPDGYLNRGRAQRLRTKAAGTGHQAPAAPRQMAKSQIAKWPNEEGKPSADAERPAPGASTELRNSRTPELLAIPTTPEELDRLAREGRITQAGLAIAEKTITLRSRMREEAEADGRLVRRDEVERVAALQLAEIRAVLLNIPARAAAAAAAMLTLEPTRQAALRELLEQEVDAAMLAAGGTDGRSGGIAHGPIAHGQMVKDEQEAAG